MKNTSNSSKLSSERMINHFSAVLTKVCTPEGGSLTAAELIRETQDYYSKKGLSDVTASRVAMTLAYFMGSDVCVWISRQRAGITHSAFVVSPEVRRIQALEARIDSRNEKNQEDAQEIHGLRNGTIKIGNFQGSEDDEEEIPESSPVAAPAPKVKAGRAARR